MGTPINAFEVVESIRFFASLVGTEGVGEDSKRLANEYLYKLLQSLNGSVQDTIASMSNIKIVK